MRILFAIKFIFFSLVSCAQITAQGQGGRTVLWSAIGLEQGINKNLTLRSVFGYSRNSGMYSYIAFKNPGIITLRQELDYRYNSKFKISLGFLYAERFYEDELHPDYINEIRIYPKIEHKFNAGRLFFSHYLRVDFRDFYQPHFERWHKPFELRSRYRMKVSILLDKKNRNYFVIMSELLAATDEEVLRNGRKEFDRFRYTENRTSVYWRYHFSRPDIWFDLGIMHQHWKDVKMNKYYHTYMLQTDIIIVNPFKSKNRKLL